MEVQEEAVKPEQLDYMYCFQSPKEPLQLAQAFHIRPIQQI